MVAAKKYTEDHEAIVFDDSTGLGTVSITDYAQGSLGDVVFVELPALETEVTKGGQELPRLLLRARWRLTFVRFCLWDFCFRLVLCAGS